MHLTIAETGIQKDELQKGHLHTEARLGFAEIILLQILKNKTCLNEGLSADDSKSQL